MATEPADRRPPLVMLPGIDGTAALFGPQMPRLQERFRTLAFPYPPGHPASMESLVAEVGASVDAIFATEDLYLFGESFGGALALSCALAWPGRLRGLILLNTFPYLSDRAGLGLLRGLLRVVPWSVVWRVRPIFRFVLHGRGTPRAVRSEVERLSEPDEGGDYRARLTILHRFDVRDRLPDVTVPTLVLAADRDRLLDSVGAARAMAARLPDARLEIVHGLGHVCMMAPGFDLRARIDAWLDGRVG